MQPCAPTPASSSHFDDRLKAGLQTPKIASNAVRSPGFSRSLAPPTARMRTAGLLQPPLSFWWSRSDRSMLAVALKPRLRVFQRA